MKLSRVLGQTAIACALAALALGCSGVRASKGISPADFLLPGLLKNAPSEPPPLEQMTNSVPGSLLAQAR